jgi:hypothetical protein
MPTDYAADIPLNAAIAAHNGTSTTPESRGAWEVRSYAETLAADHADHAALLALATTPEKQAVLTAEFARYREGCRVRTLKYLASRARCLSILVAGPANFPGRRNQQRNDVASKRGAELAEYRIKALAAIRRAPTPELQPILTSDSDASTRLARKVAALEAARDQMKAANAAIRKHAKAGHAAQLVALGELGLSEATARKVLTPNYMGRVGFEPWELTNLGAEIRRLKARSETVATAQAAPTTAEEGTVARLEDAPADNRVRLFFPGKPNEEVRATLKASGFRWAPSTGAWQAYRNANSLATARRVAGVVL